MHLLAQTPFFGDPNFAKSPSSPLSNHAALQLVKNWMKQDLPCIAGRREFLKNRYMIEIATQEKVPEIFARYCNRLENRRAVACLFIFNNWEYMSDRRSVSDVFYFLADQMQHISDVSVETLAQGGALTKKVSLRCPVTEVTTIYDDFECIAFCPQSNNPDDPLYDPLLAMPFPAVNMSSDMYAFSNFVADMIEQRYRVTVTELSKDKTETEKALFNCVAQWHRIASKTIENYESLTDTSLCPVHINAENNQWIAGHKDPAFAEQIKEVHTHELPVLYGARIVRQWLDFFYKDRAFSAAGLARDGTILA
ncbi:MAG: hypothetical protein AAGA53_15090 [Pseudomonadota bacterium]